MEVILQDHFNTLCCDVVAVECLEENATVDILDINDVLIGKAFPSQCEQASVKVTDINGLTLFYAFPTPTGTALTALTDINNNTIGYIY